MTLRFSIVTLNEKVVRGLYWRSLITFFFFSTARKKLQFVFISSMLITVTIAVEMFRADLVQT